ncbi:MAG: low temperature requirement protein A [bacterium]|nr:low temperature requirement protein A [bacterium]
MVSRDPEEFPRAATPLELLYDLCFVVAIAQAAFSLHHSISEGHGAEGAIGFGLVFFAVWWAWMGFAWFASAFDTDDPLYRLKVFVQIVGVLMLAAGVPRAFEGQDYSLITLGYTVMRVGLIAQWLRAARADRATRKTALRYAVGIACLQIGWLALLSVPSSQWIYGWMVLAPLELALPWWAEKAGQTNWNSHHIAERYGLLTIIVIGESVLAATLAIQSAIDLETIPGELVAIIASAPIILFAMWWLYFSRPGHAMLTSMRGAFLWGYGHYFIFAAAAAAGAGIAVLVDHATEHAHLSAFWAGQALAIPVSVYLLSIWAVHLRRCAAGKLEMNAYLLTSILVLLTPLTGAPTPAVAILLVMLTALTTKTSARLS